VQLVLPIDNGTINHWLVVLTPLKNMKVNGKDYPIYEMENEKCSKLQTTNQKNYGTKQKRKAQSFSVTASKFHPFSILEHAVPKT